MRLTSHPAQAIEVPQEAHWYCESDGDRCDAPTADSRGHPCSGASSARHGACGDPRECPRAGDRPDSIRLQQRGPPACKPSKDAGNTRDHGGTSWAIKVLMPIHTGEACSTPTSMKPHRRDHKFCLTSYHSAKNLKTSKSVWTICGHTTSMIPPVNTECYKKHRFRR
jgi:hypothetical protein